MSDFIAVYDDALSVELCKSIISRFEASDERQPGVTGGGVDRTKKDSIDLTISSKAAWKPIYDEVMDATLQRLIDYFRTYRFLLCGPLAVTVRAPQTGRPYTLDEQTVKGMDDKQLGGLIMRLYRPGSLNIQKYVQGCGGYHHWHSEVYPRDADCETLHRVLLFMYYLNSIDDGGETEFYYQQQKVRAEQGRMVIAPAGFTHTHKGHVPRSSDKYVLTSWIMFQRCEAVFA